MKILLINIALLLIIVTSHLIIINQNGRNMIAWDIVLLCSWVGLFILNIFCVYKIITKISKPVVLALSISLLYYIVLFIFPLYSGSR